MDPYAPPRSELEPGAARAPAGARWTTSMTLGIVGILLFWVTLSLSMSGRLHVGAGGNGSVILGLAGLVACILHLVGVGLGLRPRRGKRLAGVLVNVVPLAIIVGLVVVGLKMKH